MSLSHALNSLRRAPAFALTVILTLALGIAAAASMFAVVYGVLLAPLPYGEPQRLVSLSLQSPVAGELRQPLALQRLYAQQARGLESIAFHRTGSTNVWLDGADQGADSVIATWISASMMPLLKVRPLLGRSFNAEEELRGGPDAVILSEAEWRSRFGGAEDVLGRTLSVNSVQRQVIGVMPAGFAFPSAATRLWLPAKLADSASLGDFNYWAVARLAAGISVEQAQQELEGLLPRLAEAYPRLETGGASADWLAQLQVRPGLMSLRERVSGDSAPLLWVLAAAAALVLLVALANAANLLLIRADGRQPELALRAALGAGAWRASLPLLAEALLLGAAAGALALPLVFAALKALRAFGPADLPRLDELGLGLPTLGFSALLSVLVILVCAAAPSLRLRRAGALQGLHEGGRGGSAGRRGLRLRAAATALQIAVALVVTVGSGLLLRSAHGLSRVQPGFDTEQVFSLRMQLPMARYDEAKAVAFFARLSERVKQLPSVSSAGVSAKVPLQGGLALELAFIAEDQAGPQQLPVNIVDAGYFQTLAIPLLAGRAFAPLGSASGSELILSRNAAKRLFADSDPSYPVGRRLRLAPAGPEYTVVGIAADVRDLELARPPAALVYRPLSERIDPLSEPTTRRNMALLVKSGLPAEQLAPALRQIVHELDPAVAVYQMETMTEVRRASTARLTLVLVLLAIAAALTLLLSSVGLYGLMAYGVSLRTREFGIRVALGAAPAAIARWVAARGLLLAAAGVALGLLLTIAAAPLLRAFLYGVAEHDPAILIFASLLLLGIALLASWLPARRAAAQDPAQALRRE